MYVLPFSRSFSVFWSSSLIKQLQHSIQEEEIVFKAGTGEKEGRFLHHHDKDNKEKDKDGKDKDKDKERDKPSDVSSPTPAAYAMVRASVSVMKSYITIKSLTSKGLELPRRDRNRRRRQRVGVDGVSRHHY